MSNLLLSCTGIWKTFTRPIERTGLLQERLLGLGQRSTWSVRALRGVSVRLARGEWVAIAGPNGSGKTTLLRILGGLLPVDRGDVRVMGSLSYFFGVGAGFHPDLPPEENLYLHGLLHGMRPAEIRRRTDAIIAFAGVESHRQVPLKCFSSGMQYRLGFAAAVHVQADVYLFDEVARVADRKFQHRCEEHFLKMRRDDKALVIVSHDLDFLRTVCDRILHIDAGKIVSEERCTPIFGIPPQSRPFRPGSIPAVPSAAPAARAMPVAVAV